MYGDPNIQMQQQRSLDIHNMFADFSQSKDCLSIDDNNLKNKYDDNTLISKMN
jgi:hypothetical protein